MRVIAGTYRSRLLSAPAGTATRPTSDRLRETLFNILAPRIAGAHFVDLYAGTGAVGIEALSRGAAHVYFAENDPAALRSLRANLATLRIAGGFALEDRGTAALLKRLERTAGGIDLVFLDPPYEDDAAYASTLTRLGESSLLGSGALVVAEHSSRPAAPLAARYGRLRHVRTVRQGDSSLSFFADENATSANRDATTQAEDES